MTKKRLLLIGGFLAACVCLLLGVGAVMPTGPGVTKANFDRIQVGMTKPEVRAIFGRSEAFIAPASGEVPVANNENWGAADGSYASIWFSGGIPDDLEEEDYRVVSMTWHESSETPFQKIRRWLHLP